MKFSEPEILAIRSSLRFAFWEAREWIRIDNNETFEYLGRAIQALESKLDRDKLDTPMYFILSMYGEDEDNWSMYSCTEAEDPFTALEESIEEEIYEHSFLECERTDPRAEFAVRGHRGELTFYRQFEG